LVEEGRRVDEERERCGVERSGVIREREKDREASRDVNRKGRKGIRLYKGNRETVVLLARKGVVWN
jgi:hypothetical protein